MTNALGSFDYEDNEGIKQFLQSMSKYTLNYEVTLSEKPKVVLLNHQKPITNKNHQPCNTKISMSFFPKAKTRDNFQNRFNSKWIWGKKKSASGIWISLYQKLISTVYSLMARFYDLSFLWLIFSSEVYLW